MYTVSVQALKFYDIIEFSSPLVSKVWKPKAKCKTYAYLCLGDAFEIGTDKGLRAV